MNNAQEDLSNQIFNEWALSQEGLLHEKSPWEVWLACSEWMFGNPLSVGNLQAKIAELEERLANSIRPLESQIESMAYSQTQQLATIREQRDVIVEQRAEIKKWQDNLDEFSRDYKAARDAEYEALEQEFEQSKQAFSDNLRDQGRNLTIRRRNALRAQSERMEAIKTASLDAQRQIMTAEYDRQITQMIEKLEAHYAERYEDLRKTERQYAQKLLADQERGLRVEFEASLRTSLEKIANLESSFAERFSEQEHNLRTEFEARFNHRLAGRLENAVAEAREGMVSDNHHRQALNQLDLDLKAAQDERDATLSSRLGIRIDQFMEILKGMVDLEVRNVLPNFVIPKSALTDAIQTPAIEEFEFWYDQIPQQTYISVKDLARASWLEAIGRVKLKQ